MKRCEVNQKLEPSTTCHGKDCISIRTESLVSWSHKVEECIQANLSSLVSVDFSKITPDPSSCQLFERRAMETVNACYKEKFDQVDKPQLCHEVGEEIDEVEENDLKTLVSEFRIGGDYHNTTVDSGIPELVRDCGHSNTADRLYTNQPTYRLIFCTWQVFRSPNEHLPPVPEQIINFLSRTLGDDSSNFVFGGPDLTTSCSSNVPNNAQKENIHYQIVTWFASSSNMAARNWTETNAIFDRYNQQSIIAFYELNFKPSQYNIRDSSKCGDGVRHSGEVCDYALLDSPACTFTCEINQESEVQYECSVDRLNPSSCWVQVCGDGNRTNAEACDDGNLDDNDGCDSNCQIEPQYYCSTKYNQTSLCRLLTVQPVAVQHQRQIVQGLGLTEQPPAPRVIVDLPLETSSARSIISRTKLLISAAIITTLWTAMTLA